MTIVVGYRPDEYGDAALQHAIVRSRASMSNLVIVNIARSDGKALVPADEFEVIRAEAQDKTGHEVYVRQSGGTDVAATIVDVVNEFSARLVIIGLRPRTQVGKLLLGSTAQRILMESPVPVLVVRPEHPTNFVA